MSGIHFLRSPNCTGINDSVNDDMTSFTPESKRSDAYDQIIVDITKYVFHYQIDNSKAWEKSRLALLDALGCAVETVSTSAECMKLVGPVVPKITVPGGFKLPGTSYQLDPVKGAFDLGTLIRYLDHNDAYGGAEWGHPSDNVGAILAVGDWLSRQHVAACEVPSRSMTGNENPGIPKLTMRTILEALIKTYEIQGCLQELNSFNAVGLDHTILVKVASTAVVSWLLGCSEAQTLASISHAFQDGHSLRTFRQFPNTGPRKGWAAGDACMRAVQMALLASKGQPGAPTVLTDPKWGFYARLFQGKEFKLRRPFGTWVIEHVFFKLVPAEGHAISAVEAALQIVNVMRQRSLDAAADILKVNIRTQKPAFTIVNKSGPLSNAADRDHCLQYIVAVILLKGDTIEAKDYMDDSPWAMDKRTDDLRTRIEVVEDEQFTKDYYDPKKRSCSSAIAVQLKNQTDLTEAIVEYPAGSPRRQDTREQLQSKFRRNAGFDFNDEQIDWIQTAVEDDDCLVHEFVDRLCKP